ncbi:MAG: transcriptional regulator [Legionella sp. 40-6]|nr:YafY family transcriptional regulator [Legionella sp.]OJY06307.1 MAG: transcriptional regulator [Legionella sp. 40-6]
MSRTQRLFDLLQILRSHRYPVTGQHLAQELKVSPRTIYRDIATLQGQGAAIEGEPGLGYILRPGFMLPPLMFSEDEIEALVLGARWVSHRADQTLSVAASQALAKISAVLPQALRKQIEFTGLLIGPAKNSIKIDDDYEATIRFALRKECKLQITYLDYKGNESLRTIWPLALGFFEEIHTIVAWCELRNDFRHFRTDRILHLQSIDNRFPEGRHILLKRWQRLHNIPEQ